MGSRFRALYALLAVTLVVWAFTWPAVLPLLLLVGLALIAGVHALVGMDVRSGSGGQGMEHRIELARSRYPSAAPRQVEQGQ